MPQNTEAYVARGEGGPLAALEIIQLPDLGPNELLVDPVAVSICHSDLRAANGTFLLNVPLIPGHEGSGFVKQIGANVAGFKVGDAVVLSYSSCGLCKMCSSGRNPYCQKLFELNFAGKRLDGTPTAIDKNGKSLNSLFFGQSSMSRLILAHESSAVKVDASSDELKKLAPLGCGIQTGSGTILNLAKPAPGSSIAVIGGGAVGISALLAASLSSPSHLILVDVSEEKLRAEITNIATHKINSSGFLEGEMAKKLKEITNGDGVDLIIDAVGHREVLAEGHSALAVCGTLVTVGGGDGEASINIGDHLVKGATYRGTHQGDSVSRVHIPFLIKLWRQGKFPFDKMLTFYPFEDLERAVQDMKAGKCIKPVLVF